MSTTITILFSIFLSLLFIIVLIAIRSISTRQVNIKMEIQEINEKLSAMPTENGLREYMFAQDQQLRSINEELFSKPDAEVLQQYIQEQANQIIAVISTHDESRKPSISREHLENASKATNQLLEKVLWTLRFNEDKYLQDTAPSNGHHHTGSEKNKELSIQESVVMHGKNESHDDMQTALDNCNDDGYAAMLMYMQQSGKSGVEALRALEKAKVMNNS